MFMAKRTRIFPFAALALMSGFAKEALVFQVMLPNNMTNVTSLPVSRSR